MQRTWARYYVTLQMRGVMWLHLIVSLLAEQMGFPMAANWIDVRVSSSCWPCFGLIWVLEPAKRSID